MTDTSVTIAWTTDEPASSEIDYGLTKTFGNVTLLKSLDQNHRLTLIGLQPNTLYHYRITSSDAAGNTAFSRNFKFSTLERIDKTPPVITAIGSSGVGITSATITWTTNKATNSQVEYGATTAYGNTTTVNTLETNHRVTLIGLAVGALCHYRVKSQDATGSQASSADFTLTTLPLNVGSIAGKLEDGRIYLPANYTNFAPPAVGVAFADSAFGSTITRLSNGMAQFNDAVHHEYATMSPFNRDNTRVLLATQKTGYYIADRSGNLIVSASSLVVSNAAEPRWSTTDPNVFYFHEGNQIKKYDLRAMQKSVVRTFTQYTAIDFGGGESDISEDGDHLVVIGDTRYVGLYTISTGTLGNTLDINGRGGYDYFDVTPNNNVIARWNAEGAARYQGFELYDRNMSFIRQVTTFGGHADRGRDLNGDEVLLVVASNDRQPPTGCENNGVEKVRLADGRRTCLIGLDWNAEIHVSANTDGRNPWVLISTTDATSGTAGFLTLLAANWQQLWKPHYNELILVKVDGSEQRRIAHHRSRTADNYWYMPRATISRDGKYAIFDSNLGAKPFTYYTDSFLVNLTN